MRPTSSNTSKNSRSSSDLDVNKHRDRQELKRSVINSQTKQIDFVALTKLQAYYPNAKALYLKTTRSGEAYVSFSAPLVNQLRAKRDLGTAVKHNLANSFVQEGYGAAVDAHMQTLWANLSKNGGVFVPTHDFREAVVKLALAQQRGPMTPPSKPATQQQTAEKSVAVKPGQEESSIADPIVTRYQELRTQLVSDIQTRPEEIKARYADWDKHQQVAGKMNDFFLLHSDTFKRFCDGDDNEMNAYLRQQYPGAESTVRASMAQMFDETPVLGLMSEKPATEMIEAYASLERRTNAL